MYRRVEMVLVGVLAVLYMLSALSRRFPHVDWLQVFRYDPPRLTDEQRARARRRANVYAGVELILLGLALPMIYAALTVMFFNEFTTGAGILVFAGSALCVVLGITGIWRRRE